LLQIHQDHTGIFHSQKFRCRIHHALECFFKGAGSMELKNQLLKKEKRTDPEGLRTL
jgi:hypothetical protein